jgi:hypothetical protein
MSKLRTLKYSSGFTVAAVCMATSEQALGLLAVYYSMRQVRKLRSLMS